MMSMSLKSINPFSSLEIITSELAETAEAYCTASSKSLGFNLTAFLMTDSSILEIVNDFISHLIFSVMISFEYAFFKI